MSWTGRTRDGVALALALLRPGPVRLRVVDGTWVRDNLFTDFTMAGHDRVYTFIPEGEIWLESSLPVADWLPVLLHELRERFMMGGGDDYHTAHGEVTEIEARERGGKSDDDNAYEKGA